MALMMKFKRIAGRGYTVTVDTKIYDIERSNGYWVLTIWSIREVAGLVIRGADIDGDTYDTKGNAVAVATAYEALGDDYRGSEHGHRARFTTAVLNAFEGR
jgi:hypothetical protein